MNIIIILDFETGEVHVAPYDSSVYNEFSDFIQKFNYEKDLCLSEYNCQWMIVDKLTIEHHNF